MGLGIMHRGHRSGLADPWCEPIMALIRIAAAALVLMPVAVRASGLDVERREDRLVIRDDAGRPAAVFTFGEPLVGRPALRDLHAPGGIMVTRPCPIRPGIDPDDHATVHPGVMLCFSDLSGADPWRQKTPVRFKGFVEEPATDVGAVRFSFAADYLSKRKGTSEARVVCHEQSRVAIVDRMVAGAPVRIITWDARLTAPEAPVTFADVEEMGFGVRLVKDLAPKWGGRYLAAHGGRDEAGVFGTQAGWCDATGNVAGSRVGAMLVDRGPADRRAFFHARDYGWLLANPFGRQTYTTGASAAVTLPPGGELELDYAIVLHGDVPDDALTELAGAVLGDSQ
jgi:hypothetical protein